MQNQLLPPLKWAGGKRWFVSRHLDLVPTKFNTYIEPFLGSGALFFSLRPTRAVLSDINGELINLYCVIRDNPAGVRKVLLEHRRKHCEEHYYRVRASRPTSPLRKAARTLYLNRTCWNGLYRVNRQGEFNVPMGTKSSVVLETDDFEALSSAFRDVKIVHADFESVLEKAKGGDFAFVDPPYTLAHNHNGFVKYNESLFTWDDQVRLRDAVTRAVSRKVKVLVTNAAHSSIYELYKGFEQKRLTRVGVISGRSEGRGRFDEVAIKCY